MSLVTTKQMLKRARQGKFAIGAFNVNNMEVLEGVMAAVNEKKSPVILQVSESARKYAHPIYLQELIQAAVRENPGIPIALHLDHGSSFVSCKQAVDEGYTSIMIDASHEFFKKNIEVTKKVVDYAHKRGVVVEAELGKLIGEQFDSGDGGKFSSGVYTDPDQAVEFVKRTGVDSLAIAIGTSHGAYKFKKGRPRLDFKRLTAIAGKLKNVPLVLHGASSVDAKYVNLCNKYGGKIKDAKGVPERMLSRAAKLGVCKINCDTDLRLAMTCTVRKELFKNPSNFDPRKYLGSGREAIKQLVMHKIDVFGSGGKA